MLIAGREPPEQIKRDGYVTQMEIRGETETHKLLALKKEDARKLLEERGIKNKVLQDAIINETSAIPQLLGIAADIVEALPPSERKPEIFKTKARHWEEKLLEYVEILLKHIDKTLEEAIFVTAIPRKFDKKTISVALGRTITPTQYHRLTKLSFYKQTENKKYMMHQETRKILLKIIPQEDKEQITEKLLTYYQQKYKETQDPEYLTETIHITQIINEDKATDILWKTFQENLSKSKYETCQQLLDALTPTKPSNIITKKTLQAQLDLRTAKINEAIKELQDIKKCEIKEDPKAWNNKGIALQTLGEAYMRKGDKMSARGALCESLRSFRKILQLGVDYWEKIATRAIREIQSIIEKNGWICNDNDED